MKQLHKKNTIARRAKADLTCWFCGQEIYFDSRYKSEATGKNIPLEPGTLHFHNCPIRNDIATNKAHSNRYQQLDRQTKQWQRQKFSLIQQPRSSTHYQTFSHYLKCRYCGQEIYFDKRFRTKISHKLIPLEKSTGKPHSCPEKFYNYKK